MLDKREELAVLDAGLEITLALDTADEDDDDWAVVVVAPSTCCTCTASCTPGELTYVVGYGL